MTVFQENKLMVSKQRKKKEYKDDFFKNNIDSVAMQPV
jgi:hypothetical protein